MTENLPVVLCVDDDARTLDILRKVLSFLPVQSEAASCAQAAVDLAGRLQPHLLILDLMLPERDGWQILEAIRQGPHRSDMRVLVLTAKDNSVERLLAQNVARVDAFMGKPFDIAELARHVLSLLGLPATDEWPGPSSN